MSRVWNAATAGKAQPWRAASLNEARPAPAQAAASTATGPGVALDLEARRREARDMGYAEGRAQGQRDGMTAAHAQAAQLATVLVNAREAWNGLEGALAEQVVDLAVELARQVLRDEPKLRRDALAAVVKEALASLAEDAGRPQIVVHPADVQVLKAHLGEDLARGQWNIVEDLRMEPGGCRITTSTGEVDATMATRWRRVMATLGRHDSWVSES